MDPLATSLEDKIWDAHARSYLSWILVVVLLAVHLWVAGEDWIWGASARKLLSSGALNAQRIDGGELWRLSASLLLHGDLLHLVFNALAVLALGRLSQAIFGWIRSVEILYLSGLAGAFLSWSMGATRTVGASGAIFGLLAALCIFGWKYRGEMRGELGDLLRRRLLFWGSLNLCVGLFIPNIDNPSHFGGFICGCILGAIVGHRWETVWDRILLAFPCILGIWCTIATM